MAPRAMLQAILSKLDYPLLVSSVPLESPDLQEFEDEPIVPDSAYMMDVYGELLPITKGVDSRVRVPCALHFLGICHCCFPPPSLIHQHVCHVPDQPAYPLALPTT